MAGALIVPEESTVLAVDRDEPEVSRDYFIRATAPLNGSRAELGNAWASAPPPAGAGQLFATSDAGHAELMPSGPGNIGAAKINGAQHDGVAFARCGAPNSQQNATHFVSVFRLHAWASSMLYARLYANPSGVLTLRRRRSDGVGALGVGGADRSQLRRPIRFPVDGRVEPVAADPQLQGQLGYADDDSRAGGGGEQVPHGGEWGVQMMRGSVGAGEFNGITAWSLHPGIAASPPAPRDTYLFDGLSDTVRRDLSGGGVAREMSADTRIEGARRGPARRWRERSGRRPQRTRLAPSLRQTSDS